VTRQRLTVVLVLLFISLANAQPLVWAAKLTASLETPQTLKGIVTAKAEKSFTVREGSRTLEVAITDATQVTGQRDSFGKLAVGDIVRVDGRMAQDKQLLAGRIEVLFAAGTTVGSQSHAPILGGLLSQAPALAGLLSVLVNGGVTVMLP
jgi:hypothetical protein